MSSISVRAMLLERCLLSNFSDLNLSSSTVVKVTEIALAVAKKCMVLTWKSDLGENNMF